MSNGEWLEFLRIKVRNGRELGFEKLAELGDMISVNEGDLWQLQVMAGLAHSEILSLRRTRDDLQEANNRYLERACAAEAEIKRRDEKTGEAKQRIQQILRDKVTSSYELGENIDALAKFIDMIEARAMAVDGPVTPFCDELHAASDLEKSQFQAILSKLYQFRTTLATKPLISPEMVERLKKPLVTLEWEELEDGLDSTTGKPLDPNWSKAWKTICEVFHALGYPSVDEYEHTAVISSIAERSDSLDFVEMLIEVEKHSGFMIDENELPHFKICTIGDVVGLLAAKMAKAGAA